VSSLTAGFPSPMALVGAVLIPAPHLGPPINPALLEQAQARAEARQNRLADQVTAFAGSMPFVYIHIIWFACWIVFGVEQYPYGLLTMVVSLEAIFLSTFVLISQNRADANRQIVADQQWATVQEEDEQNVELLDLSRQILALTKEVHSVARSLADPRGDGSSDLDSDRSVQSSEARSAEAETSP
jgi:uncharacterized membrane protein